ncbi:MAG: (d)CMP kinase [Planctomycetes bacterium]|nr:(d)CMP kinase [Planctomycetota bacterium]
MIVTIDGPAGSGKSSAARQLARRLGIRFLDTGAMYRAVTLAAMRRGVSWDDADALAALARDVRVELRDDRVYLDDEDVTQAVRGPQVTGLIYHLADNPEVRAHLVELQRQAARGLSVVTEGRDQGTVVFPEAECKIFLTATPDERARRRMGDLLARGQTITFDEVFEQQTLRDERDSRRPVGALRKADDAIEVITDGMTPEQVVERLEQVIRARLAAIQGLSR